MAKSLGALIVGGMLAASAAGGAQAGEILIDNFNTNSTSLSTTAASGFVSSIDNNGGGSDVPNIIGGYRDIYLHTVSNTDPGIQDTTAKVLLSGTGRFAHSQSDGVISQSLLVWNGVGDKVGSGNGGSSLVGSDLNSSAVLSINSSLASYASTGGISTDITGLTGMGVFVVRANVALNWLFGLVDGDGDLAWTTVTSMGSLTNTAINKDFSTFTGIGAIDLDDIHTVFIAANAPVPNGDVADISIDRAYFVPEPASLALLGVGLLGLGVVRRRKAA